jgi:hypothetical protein
MNQDWTRSQPKRLRPFWAVATLEDALSDATLELVPGGEPLSEETKVLEAQQMQDLDPVLRPHLDLAVLCAALGHRAADYELVVTVRTPQMLRRVLFDRWPLDEAIPEEIDLGTDVLADAKISGQLEISVAICCKGASEVEPGWPVHPGAWLSRKTFSIGTDRRQAAFEFDLLTQQEIATRKLSQNTAFVVDIEVELNAVPHDGQCLVSVLVAQSLLETLRSNAVRPTAFRVLTMEIMDAVLEAKCDDIDPSEGVEKGSLLQRLLAWAGDGKQPMPLHDFSAICKSPERRRALVQHQIGLGKTLEEMK